MKECSQFELVPYILAFAVLYSIISYTGRNLHYKNTNAANYTKVQPPVLICGFILPVETIDYSPNNGISASFSI